MKLTYRVTGNDLQDLLKRLAGRPETISHRKPARRPASRNAERPDRAARSRIPSRQGAGK